MLTSLTFFIYSKANIDFDKLAGNAFVAAVILSSFLVSLLTDIAIGFFILTL